MFQYPAYDLKRFIRMPERCAHCAFRFEIEPGLFWGAMYITYAINMAFFIVGLIAYFIWNLPVLPLALGIVLLSAVLAPLSVRYARVLMLYVFSQVKFEPECFDSSPEQNWKRMPGEAASASIE